MNQVMISQNKSCDDVSESVVLPIEPADEDMKKLSDTKKKDFCVCVKPLDFPGEPQLANRLIEWIESLMLLGAQKIVIYIYSGKFHNDIDSLFVKITLLPDIFYSFTRGRSWLITQG